MPRCSMACCNSDPGDSDGVRWHPNDRGMAGYAQAIFAVFPACYPATEVNSGGRK